MEYVEHVPFGSALDLIQEGLAMVVVNQLADERLREPLSDVQKVDLVKDTLDVFRMMAMLLHESERKTIPTPRRDIPAAARRRVLERDENQCLACGSTENLTIDHVVPLDAGGAHEEGNFQTLCGACNSRKGVTAVDYRLSSPPGLAGAAWGGEDDYPQRAPREGARVP